VKVSNERFLEGGESRGSRERRLKGGRKQWGGISERTREKCGGKREKM